MNERMKTRIKVGGKGELTVINKTLTRLSSVHCRLWPKEEWPTKTKCGIKSASSARAVRCLWPDRPSRLRERAPTASNVSVTFTPRSAPAATPPSQVRRSSHFVLLTLYLPDRYLARSSIWALLLNVYSLTAKHRCYLESISAISAAKQGCN